MYRTLTEASSIYFSLNEEACAWDRPPLPSRRRSVHPGQVYWKCSTTPKKDCRRTCSSYNNNNYYYLELSVALIIPLSSTVVAFCITIIVTAPLSYLQPCAPRLNLTRHCIIIIIIIIIIASRLGQLRTRPIKAVLQPQLECECECELPPPPHALWLAAAFRGSLNESLIMSLLAYSRQCPRYIFIFWHLLCDPAWSQTRSGLQVKRDPGQIST